MRHSVFIRASRYDRAIPIEDITSVDAEDIPTLVAGLASYLVGFLTDLGEHARLEDYPVAHLSLELRTCRKRTVNQSSHPGLELLIDLLSVDQKNIPPSPGT